ncbi:hypothetical protein Tco_1008503 [Tanacetum coccineum]
MEILPESTSNSSALKYLQMQLEFTLIVEEEEQLVLAVVDATKDKGKAIMTESEPEKTTTKLKQRQERAGYEAAIRLQEQLDEEERQRIAMDAKHVSTFTSIETEDKERESELAAGSSKRPRAEHDEHHDKKECQETETTEPWAQKEDT